MTMTSMAGVRQSHCHMFVLKKGNPPTLLEFNRILGGVSHEDAIGH